MGILLWMPHYVMRCSVFSILQCNHYASTRDETSSNHSAIRDLHHARGTLMLRRSYVRLAPQHRDCAGRSIESMAHNYIQLL